MSIVMQDSEQTILELDPKNNNNDRGKDFLNLAVGGIISFNLNYFGLLFFSDFAMCKKSLYLQLNQTRIGTLIEEIYERY